MLHLKRLLEKCWYKAHLSMYTRKNCVDALHQASFCYIWYKAFLMTEVVYFSLITLVELRKKQAFRDFFFFFFLDKQILPLRMKRLVQHIFLTFIYIYIYILSVMLSNYFFTLDTSSSKVNDLLLFKEIVGILLILQLLIEHAFSICLA